MELSISVTIIIILFLILFSGFFSGSETALFSLSLIQRERLKKRGDKKASLISNLLKNPRQLIVTILVGNDLINIAASVFAAYLFISIVGKEHARWVAIAVMTPLTLVFAETIPKTLFMSHNERLAPFIAVPLSLFSKIITPIRWTFDKVADTLIKLIGVDKKNQTAIMEDDFLDMVDLSHEDGELKGPERDLIHNVFEFSDTKVFEVMTPLDDLFSLPETMETADIIASVKSNHHSRIPVYREKKDNITGMLYVKDLLKIDMRKYGNNKKLLPKIVRKPHYISETKKIDDLLYILKQKRIHIAICLNKDGNVSGLVTMEDLLEELFGEIYDEHDPVTL